jgi:hypothetical protein
VPRSSQDHREQPSPLGGTVSLIIIDDSATNAADSLDVIVADLQAPTAVDSADRLRASFPLDGRRPVDAGGG